MELILTLSVALIAAIMIAAVICLIPVLLQIRRTALQVEKMVETVRMEIVPLSHNLTVVTHSVQGILDSAHRQVDKLEDSVIAVRDGAERLREFEENVIDRIERPLIGISAMLSAVSRGAETFIRALLR